MHEEMCWFDFVIKKSTSVFRCLFFSRFLRNRIYTLSFIVWWTRAHQNAEYSCAENHLEWIFPLNFYEEERTRRRNGGIILSLARRSGCETFIRAKGVGTKLRFVCRPRMYVHACVHMYKVDKRAHVHLAVGNLTTRRGGGGARNPPGCPRNPPMCASRTNYNILDSHRLLCTRVATDADSHEET